jgi:septal ring factor EnvC (AmiA/AmiB activator)
MSDLERTNLEAHADLCAERYKQLAQALDSMDQRLTKLENSIQDIHTMLIQHQNQNQDRYLGWAAVIITVLLGTTGWLINRLLA